MMTSSPNLTSHWWMLSNADLNNLANRSDTTGIHRSDLLSFYRADLVMEALDHDKNTHYVAMEASYRQTRATPTG